MAATGAPGRRSCGASNARNAAGNIASSPSRRGSPRPLPAIAPASVPRFQNRNTLRPVARNAWWAAAASSCARAIAVDSSITSWACSARLASRPRSTGTSDSPYTPLRAASSSAGASAAAADPPAAITPTVANCDAPVNTSSDIAQVWAGLRPAATDSTPKEMP